MKGNGLSSTSRNLLRKATKRSAHFASNQESFLASKERLKSLRLQAEKAQLERQKRELLSPDSPPLSQIVLPTGQSKN